MFEIENSLSFQVAKFVAESMDHFFRFAYIICFALFLCIRLSVLYDMLWLYALSIALFLVSFIIYGIVVFKVRMYSDDWDLATTWRHYAYLRCIFPKQKFKI